MSKDLGLDRKLDLLAAAVAPGAAAVFRERGWTYGGGTGPEFTPTEGYLAVTVRHLLQTAMEADGEISTRTGRFAVYRDHDEGMNEDNYTVALFLGEATHEVRMPESQDG